MNSTIISYVNSFPGNQPWFPHILHSTAFTHEFMIMNSYMISLSCIRQHEFKDESIHMNSDIWFHDSFILCIHMRFHNHEFICDISWHEFIYEFMYTWIHVYQGSRWHFAIKLTWVYSGSGLPRNEGLPSNLLQLLLEDLGSVLSHYC